MKKYQKVLLSILAGSLLVLGGIQLYFSISLDNYLQELVEKRFKKATNGDYDLDIGDLDLEVWNRQFKVSNVSVQTKGDAKIKLDARLGRFSVSGIQMLKYFLQDEIKFNKILLDNPNVKVTSTAKQSSDKSIRLSHITQNIADITLQVANKINIPQLDIQGLSLTYNQSEIPNNPLIAFENSDITMSNIKIDSSALNDKRVLPSKDITTNIRNFKYHTKNGWYNLKLHKMKLSSRDSSLQLDSLRLQPRYSKDEFRNLSDYEINRLKLALDKVQVEGLDPKKLNEVEGIAARKIRISNPEFSIFRDKTKPFPPNRHPPLPQQMLRKVPFPLAIHDILVRDGYIKYSQRKPQSEDIGYITFENLSADLTNITNIDQQLKKHGSPMMKAKTNVMGEGKLNATFKFPMDGLTQYINGRLSSMDMTTLNNAVVPMAFVRIDHGQILGMDFDMYLKRNRSSGTVKLRYKDLKVSLLKKKSKKENLGKKMISFLANTIKIKSSNTGKDLRDGTIDFKRIKRKSTFNYWWKSLSSGLKGNVGL